MMRFSSSIFLIVVALCGARVSTFAQAVPDSTKVYSIADVSVFGSRSAEGEVVPAQMLSGEELRRLSVVSVADAIRYFSGVQIKDYGGVGGLKTVNIRSMGSHHVGVFYDGVQLGNAQNGTIDLGRFSMDNMEAISLYNGQRSNIFQSAKDFASAGAIYLQTRRPVFEAGRRDNLRLALKGGSFGTLNPSVLWERRLGENLDGQLSTEYLYTTGRYRFSYRKLGGYDTTEVRRNGDVRALRVEGGLFGRLPKGDWRAKVYLYDSERGYPGASVREEPGKFINEDRQWDTNIFAQGSLRQYFGAWSLMLNAKYAYDYMRYLSDPRLVSVDNHYYRQEAYFSMVGGVNIFEWWQFNLSSDVQFNTLDADLKNFVHPSRLTSLTAAATALEFERLKFQASVLYTHVHDETRTDGGGGAGDKNRWTPAAVLSWRPFAVTDFTLRAFYKHIFRMPTFNDLYYNIIGDRNLKPEYTAQYNLGAVWRRDFGHGLLRGVEMQVDAYFNQVDDKIIAIPTNNQFAWTMINLGYVEIRGLDAAVQTGFRFGGTDVKARLNYTYQKAQDFTDKTDDWYGGQIPYIPWHSGSAVVGAYYKNWSLNYSFIYTGERYESNANTLENRAPPWFTHDISLSKAIRPGKSELRLTAEVNNIFNQQYEVVQWYPMPGTNLKIKIEWTL